MKFQAAKANFVAQHQLADKEVNTDVDLDALIDSVQQEDKGDTDAECESGSSSSGRVEVIDNILGCIASEAARSSSAAPKTSVSKASHTAPKTGSAAANASSATRKNVPQSTGPTPMASTLKQSKTVPAASGDSADHPLRKGRAALIPLDVDEMLNKLGFEETQAKCAVAIQRLSSGAVAEYAPSPSDTHIKVGRLFCFVLCRVC